MSDPNDRIDGLPVAGYRPQTAGAVHLVNRNKLDEERMLRFLDELANSDDIDKRWLAIGRTQLEQAFMAINRAIFRPVRVTALPHYPEPDVYERAVRWLDAGCPVPEGDGE